MRSDANIVELRIGEGGQGAALAGKGDPCVQVRQDGCTAALWDAVGVNECHGAVPFVICFEIIIPILDV